MPKYNNRFASPTFLEETIENDEGIVGVIRIKPSSVLWKPKGEHRFYCISLDDFASWMTGAKAGAKRTSS